MAVRSTSLSSCPPLVRPLVFLAAVVSGSGPSVHYGDEDPTYASQDCQDRLAAQRHTVEVAEANLTSLRAGLENRLTDMSQLQKLITHVDKTLASDIADIKAASTIRGMDVISYRIAKTASSLGLAGAVKAAFAGIGSEEKETAASQEYEKLMRNISSDSARASLKRDDNLQTIGMLLQDLNNSQAGPNEKAAQLRKVSELRASNAQLAEVLMNGIADIKATSIVRGMEMKAFNSLEQKETHVESISDDQEATSLRAYENLVEKISAEVGQVSRDHDRFLETIGVMLQKFKYLDAQLPDAISALSGAQLHLKEVVAVCLQESPPKSQISDIGVFV